VDHVGHVGIPLLDPYHIKHTKGAIMYKLNTKQKKYLRSIVDQCMNKSDLITNYYKLFETHLVKLESIKDYETLQFEMESFVTDYFNKTHYLNNQF